MGISSLGVGSSILTQDILDQLREADESGKITPITLSIANENDKKKKKKCFGSCRCDDDKPY